MKKSFLSLILLCLAVLVAGLALGQVQAQCLQSAGECPPVPGVTAPTAATCLVVNNAWYTPTKNKLISIEIDGLTNQYVTMAYNETKLLRQSPTAGGQIIRGANFILRLYEGDKGRAGRSIAVESYRGGSHHHIVWTYSPPNSEFARRWAECNGAGVLLALIHG